MSRRRTQLLLTAELGWLVLSTILLSIGAVAQTGGWRAVWLAVIVLNLVVVGTRVTTLTGRLRPGQPNP
ncbi:hypothetical protein [Modestobacter roseus]|uniref:Uncharacterized protein n=1 Tax=Modestobacter roseus TaxID=1181884 RepID=A0A562IUV2_9ACTN|nr:hypothetical protein [Modestobacter roseus]MQA33565.1 hypothetical protein [Modestobacter roseus]TWH74801.1 hypothetical protein JD78_03346 [Modestobacter roseus]